MSWIATRRLTRNDLPKLTVLSIHLTDNLAKSIQSQSESPSNFDLLLQFGAMTYVTGRVAKTADNNQ